MTTILDLPNRVAALPKELQNVWERIFAYTLSKGQLVLPPTMHEWTERQFGSLDMVRNQTVVKIINRLTLEGALLNPARARRPAISRSDDAKIDAWVAAELTNDLFSTPEQMTPTDVFGRIHGEFCVTASNIAKYDGWHGVIICNEPHPLRFDRRQIQDYVATAWRWIEAAHSHDRQAIYPIITWNSMPKSGASLAHGHLQVALGRELPYTKIELWRRAAEQYQAESQRDYFADLVELHKALGLGLDHTSGVQRFAHLTPVRNREVVLVHKQRTGDGSDSDAPSTIRRSLAGLADALYETLHMLISFHGVRAFNVAIAFPPLADDGQNWHHVPVFARIGDRGDALTVRSDVGVMELYGMGVITADPYELLRTKN